MPFQCPETHLKLSCLYPCSNLLSKAFGAWELSNDPKSGNVVSGDKTQWGHVWSSQDKLREENMTRHGKTHWNNIKHLR